LKGKKSFEKTKHFVLKTKYPAIKFFYGDGFEGLPTYGPFDKIIITAAAPLDSAQTDAAIKARR
jgi:protein-L-isoaspartate(D-aspartate) O-methyltransferase